MSSSSIGFGEEIKKLCQKVCFVRMLIWSAAVVEEVLGPKQVLKTKCYTYFQTSYLILTLFGAKTLKSDAMQLWYQTTKYNSLYYLGKIPNVQNTIW